MVRPLINYTDLVTLASEGGYANTPALTELSAVFLLSACLVMQQRSLWESELMKISDSEWENILEMLDTAQGDLMNNWQVGSILAFVSNDTLENCLMLDGSSVLQSDYPELTDKVPSTWLSGADIVLPDMTLTGLFGAYGSGNEGEIFGENEVEIEDSNMPSHNHTVEPHSHGYTGTTIATALGGEIPATASLVSPLPSSTGNASPATSFEGDGEPISVIQKSLLVNYYIVAR
jgi:hypothetical protein